MLKNINATGNPGCTLFNSECTISAGNTLRIGPASYPFHLTTALHFPYQHTNTLSRQVGTSGHRGLCPSVRPSVCLSVRRLRPTVTSRSVHSKRLDTHHKHTAERQPISQKFTVFETALLFANDARKQLHNIFIQFGDNIQTARQLRNAFFC